MSTVESFIFAILLICGLGFFCRNVYRLFAMVCLGKWENRFDHLWARTKGMFLYAFVQLRVVSEKFGVNHFLLFWGFMFLVLINAQFFVAGVFPQFSFAFLGTIPYGFILLMADIMSLVVIGCVVIAVIRRVLFRPPHIEASADAFFILSMVATLMIAYFGLHACEIRLGEDTMTSWMPVSYGLSSFFTNRVLPLDIGQKPLFRLWQRPERLIFFVRKSYKLNIFAERNASPPKSLRT